MPDNPIHPSIEGVYFRNRSIRTMPDNPIHLTLTEAWEVAISALRAHGEMRHVKAMADTMTAAGRDGCPSHGLFRVPFHVQAAYRTKADPNAESELRDLAPAVIQADAHSGFPPLAL